MSGRLEHFIFRVKIKRPAAWFACAYAAGILIGKAVYPSVSRFPQAAEAVFLILFGLVAVVLLFRLKRRRKSFYFYVIWPSFLFFGAFACIVQLAAFDCVVPDEVIGASAAGTVESVSVKDGKSAILLKNCVVNSEQGSRAEKRLLVYADSGSTVGYYTVGNHAAEYDSVGYDSAGYDDGYDDGYDGYAVGYGDKITVSGKIKAFGRASNRGQFDAGSYYASKPGGGIYYFCSAKQITVQEQGKNFLLRRIGSLKCTMQENYRRLLPEKEAGILTAMLLGDKGELDLQTQHLYDIGGISHLISISGLHVSLIAMAVYKLLKKIRLPAAAAVGISLVFLTGYVILTGSGLSTLRAALMLSALLISFIVSRTYDMLSALSVSALVLLVSNPLILFGAGFLLSFGAILGIGLLYPRFAELLRLKKRGAAARKILSALLTAGSVQLILLPVLMWFFFQIPVYSILLNLAVLPLAAFVIVPAGIGGMIGLLGPAAVIPARFVLGTACLILRFFETLCVWVSGLPGPVVITGRPRMEQILVYYAVLATVAALAGKAGNKVLLLMPLLAILFLPKTPSGLVLEFLDVGQGDGILLRNGNGFCCLVDGGSSTVSDVGEYRLIPCLKEEGIGRIDLIVATHGDSDHINGLEEILSQAGNADGIRVGALAVAACAEAVYPETAYSESDAEAACVQTTGTESAGTKAAGAGTAYAGDSGGYGKLIAAAKRQKIPILYLKTGDKIEEGAFSMECLHPEQDFPEEGNAASLVFRIRYFDFMALLTGDLEAGGEEKVVSGLKALPDGGRITLLKAAHHGSKYSTGQEFLEQTEPMLTVISSGKDNRYGHPHAETLQRLEDAGSRIFITAESGAVRVETDGKRIRVEEYCAARSCLP